MQCPRLSYLPFLLPRIHSFFLSSLINPNIPSHEGWFSYENVPLKWHFPLGLLYDLYSGAEPNYSAGLAQNQEQKVKSEGESLNYDSVGGCLPWKLIVHFTEWPEDHLIGLDAEGRIVQDAFVNSVKEVGCT